MPKKKQHNEANNPQNEGQAYDKIMRENLLELFLPLVAEQLNFTVKKVSPLPDKQFTVSSQQLPVHSLPTVYCELPTADYVSWN